MRKEYRLSGISDTNAQFIIVRVLDTFSVDINDRRLLITQVSVIDRNGLPELQRLCITVHEWRLNNLPIGVIYSSPHVEDNRAGCIGMTIESAARNHRHGARYHERVNDEVGAFVPNPVTGLVMKGFIVRLTPD